MTEQTAKQIASRFYESFGGSDIDAMLSVFSDELETIDRGMGTVHGIPPFRLYLETLKRAMPDARPVVETLLEAGDSVVVEGRFVGTFTGPLASPQGETAPNGAAVDLRFADVSRVRAGRIGLYQLTQQGMMGESQG